MLHAVAPRPQAALAKDKERLLAIIKERSFLTKGGPFKLASGAMSDYYLDMKPTTFSPEGLALIAEIAFSVNEKTENIGARRLHTVLERLLETVSFEAADRGGQTVVVDASYVDAHLAVLAQDDDLSRYIL